MWHDVAALADLADGRAVPVDADGEPVMVVRLGDRVFATQGLCTHEDKELATGHGIGGTGWECAHHGARFDLATGCATGMPAVAPLATFPVRIDDGRVRVEW